MINILKEKGHSFEECLETSVKYHKYELTNWLNENYKCKPVPLPTYIEYYNIGTFLYFLEYGHSIDENENTCSHIAYMIGSHPVVQYLIEKGSNVEAKIRDQQIHIACEFHLASWNVQTDVVECLICKGAN